IPGPSISSACVVPPSFWAVNVYVPGVNVDCESASLYSVSLTVTAVPSAAGEDEAGDAEDVVGVALLAVESSEELPHAASSVSAATAALVRARVCLSVMMSPIR